MPIIRALILLIVFIPLVAKSAPSDVTLPKCTQAQHDSYRTQGPDGQWYATWHSQIDPYYGCYYDHEHGSNPALFSPGVPWVAGSGSWPAFGYSAAQMGMSEGHAGFKVYVFRLGGYRWMLMQHQGTARADIAACVQMHTLDIRAIRESDGVQVLDIHGMADFGASVENTSGTPLTPPGCPNQGSIVSTGVRQLPVGPESVGYEPWRADVVTGTLDTRLAFNTKNPQTACNTLLCTATLARSDVGSIARGNYRELRIDWLWFGGVNLGPTTCKPYGADLYYDCSGQAWDEEYYRRVPYVTGAN